ncbi:N-acetylmuramoyl-L-alanine amidase, partial [Yersinia enterocolitica]
MRKLLSTGLLLLLAGCSSPHRDNPHQLIDRGEYKVDTSTPSIAQNERVRFLVLHYTATDDAESLRLLTQGDVSAHYLVKTHPESLDGKPVVLQLVPESQRAWHA